MTRYINWIEIRTSVLRTKARLFPQAFPGVTLSRIPGRMRSLRRDAQVSGDVVCHVAKHRVKERTGNSGTGGLGRSSRVVYRYAGSWRNIGGDVAGRSFWKALRPRRGKVSTSHLRVFLPPANDNGQSLLMNKFRRIIAFTRRLLLLSRRHSRTASSQPRPRKRALLTRGGGEERRGGETERELYIKRRHLFSSWLTLRSPIKSQFN